MAFSAVEIIAHRGASHDAPENTASAFRLAWNQGADAVELDIRMTKDGTVVAFHDSTTRRFARVARRVSAQTWDRLRKLDAGLWKGARWKGERITTLEETLAAVPEGRRLFIEIKCGREVLPELERMLHARGKRQQPHVIIGFDLATLREARERIAHSEVCWIASPKKWSRGKRPSADALIARAKSANLDGLDVDRRFAIDREFVSRVRDAGLKLYVWTVNDAPVARKLAALGVDGIATDRPGWLRGQLEERILREQPVQGGEAGRPARA
jgi:glycerophosphoryl diester phosphodiesterase